MVRGPGGHHPGGAAGVRDGEAGGGSFGERGVHGGEVAGAGAGLRIGSGPVSGSGVESLAPDAAEEEGDGDPLAGGGAAAVVVLDFGADADAPLHLPDPDDRHVRGRGARGAVERRVHKEQFDPGLCLPRIGDFQGE